MNLLALSLSFPFPHVFSFGAMLDICLELFFLSPTVFALHEAFGLFSGTPGKAFPVSPGKDNIMYCTAVPQLVDQILA